MYRSEYDQLLRDQQWLCAICGQKAPDYALLEIDHDHNRGPSEGIMVRGLLCPSCNKGLGMFRDNPELLRKAAVYLENARETGGISPESRARKMWMDILPSPQAWADWIDDHRDELLANEYEQRKKEA